MKKTFIYLFILFCLSGCVTLQNNAKYDLANGKYKLKFEGKKYDCYVENHQDSILVYSLPQKISTQLPSQMAYYSSIKQQFIKPSLDVDILTTIFKVRPNLKDSPIPLQLNTNFNGNFYIGYRTDIYQIKYFKNPLEIFERKINHFGFSGGAFVGFGNTAMNSSTTNNAISTEYDGLILQKGIAGIIGINKLTVGLSLSLDNVLDVNRKNWIYDNKPYFGLLLGLNLN